MATSAFPALAIKNEGESPLNQFAQIEQIRSAQQSQQMGQIQLQEARVQQQSRETLMSLFAANGGDMNQTFAQAQASGKVTPTDLFSFRTQSVALQTQAAKLTEQQLANTQKENELMENGLEEFASLPVEQRTPAALKDIVGRVATQGLDVSKYTAGIQKLASDPSDANIRNEQIGLRGTKWVTDNELAQRDLASKPTVQQAQQKNEAELAKSVTELNIANQQLANMPKANEAKTERMAALAKTYAETAEANAKTAETRAQTALIGANPVKAFDPKTQQWYLTTMAQVNRPGGYTNPVKMTDTEVKSEMEATRQFDIMQSSAADYAGSLQRIGAKGLTDEESRQMASLLSDKNIFGGAGEHVLGAVGLGRANDALTELNKSNVYNSLRPELQDAMVNYIRARAAIPLAQKAISGVGRMSEMAMHLEGAIIPAPIEGPSAMTKIKAFQTEITLGSQGLMRIPGVKSPEQIRSESEGKSRAQIQSDMLQQRAQQDAIAGRGEQKNIKLPQPDISHEAAWRNLDSSGNPIR